MSVSILCGNTMAMSPGVTEVNVGFTWLWVILLHVDRRPNRRSPSLWIMGFPPPRIVAILVID